MQSRLQSLATQLESYAKVGQLPQAAIAAALTHTDDVLAVNWENPTFEVPDLVLANGYTFFDAEFDPLYTVDAETGLTQKAFGTTPEDVAWYLEAAFGDYGYMAYVTADDEERVLLVLRT